jgi:adenosylcobinamide-GDP ribazoletransferase
MLPATAAAAVALGFQLLLTGALHEDGLGDVADAFGLGRGREEIVRILSDPRLGTFGVAAVTVSIVVRVAALGALDAWGAIAALPAAHALGRAAAVGLMGALPPATGEGLGAAYARDVSGRHVVLGCGAGLLIACGGLGVWAVPAAAACAAAAGVVGLAARRRIGGLTGDVLGAVEQLGEMAVLLIAAGVSTGAHSVAWWQ